jgi:hypothetical protein
MAKQINFKVSKKGGPSATVVWDAPENTNDPRWDEVVSKPEEDINELAVQNLVIKIQAGARNRLEAGEAAVQEYVDAYKYGARVGGFTAPSLAADKVAELGFTAEQLAALKAAGMKIPGAE